MFDTDKVIVVADVTKQPYLSVARFSGGCRVNGVFYAYVLQRDILVREDWLKAYSAMDYDKFIAAVKTGAKQELPTCRTCFKYNAKAHAYSMEHVKRSPKYCFN